MRFSGHVARDGVPVGWGEPRCPRSEPVRPELERSCRPSGYSDTLSHVKGVPEAFQWTVGDTGDSDFPDS